jgi:DNA-damage-inducible protein J
MPPTAQKKTGYINTRVAPALKADAENVLGRLGVTTTEAITMFLNQIVLHQGLPFPVRIPNSETAEALRKAKEHPETLTTYESVDAMMKDVWPSFPI